MVFLALAQKPSSTTMKLNNKLKLWATASTSTQSIEFKNLLNTENFVDLVKGIWNYLLMLVVPVAVIMILYSGWKMMTAKGDATAFKAGRQMLFATIVGMIIIALADQAANIVQIILDFRN